MRRPLGLAILGLTLLLTGCGAGGIYTHIITPLDVNLNNNSVFANGAANGNTKRIRYYVDIEWDSNAIGDIMKEFGLTEVHYADLEIFSVFGIWTQTYVIVYGR